jgi:hypothetical protein
MAHNDEAGGSGGVLRLLQLSYDEADVAAHPRASRVQAAAELARL